MCKGRDHVEQTKQEAVWDAMKPLDGAYVHTMRYVSQLRLKYFNLDGKHAT